MRKMAVLTFNLSLLLLCLTSCDKSKTDLPINDAALLQGFFNRNIVPTQIFTVNATTGGVINTAEGTRITFPANALLTATGQPVTGNVSVEFKEINRKADFFLSNKPTISDGLPLETGGTWKIGITKDGANLRINPAIGIRLNIRRDSTQQEPLLLFNATPKGENNGDVNPINWGNPRLQQAIIPVDTPFRSYSFRLDSLGWGNADVFMSNPIYLPNIRVRAKNGEPLNNFSAMFIYANRRIAWSLNQRIGNEFVEGHIARDQPGHFVLAGYLGGVFTTGILEGQTITTPGQVFEVILSRTLTEAQFKEKLNTFR